MPDDPIPGSYRERVVAAGGIEAYHAQKAKEFMEAAAKIDNDQWDNINKTLGFLKGFVDVRPGDAVKEIFGSFKETSLIKTKYSLSLLENDFSSISDPASSFIDTSAGSGDSLICFFSQLPMGRKRKIASIKLKTVLIL